MYEAVFRAQRCLSRSHPSLRPPSTGIGYISRMKTNTMRAVSQYFLLKAPYNVSLALQIYFSLPNKLKQLLAITHTLLWSCKKWNANFDIQGDWLNFKPWKLVSPTPTNHIFIWPNWAQKSVSDNVMLIGWEYYTYWHTQHSRLTDWVFHRFALKRKTAALTPRVFPAYSWDVYFL